MQARYVQRAQSFFFRVSSRVRCEAARALAAVAASEACLAFVDARFAFAAAEAPARFAPLIFPAVKGFAQNTIII